MKLDTPAAVIQAFTNWIHARDLEGVLGLYEAEALFVPKPEVLLAGKAHLLEAFVELFGLEPTLEIHTREVLEAADLALVSNTWTLRGVAPDGSKVERAGQSSVVLRRDKQGDYRIVIDRL